MNLVSRVSFLTDPFKLMLTWMVKADWNRHERQLALVVDESQYHTNNFHNSLYIWSMLLARQLRHPYVTHIQKTENLETRFT